MSMPFFIVLFNRLYNKPALAILQDIGVKGLLRLGGNSKLEQNKHMSNVKHKTIIIPAI